MDKDGNGKLDVQEFRDAMDKLGNEHLPGETVMTFLNSWSLIGPLMHWSTHLPRKRGRRGVGDRPSPPPLAPAYSHLLAPKGLSLVLEAADGNEDNVVRSRFWSSNTLQI